MTVWRLNGRRLLSSQVPDLPNELQKGVGFEIRWAPNRLVADSKVGERRLGSIPGLAAFSRFYSREDLLNRPELGKGAQVP